MLRERDLAVPSGRRSALRSGLAFLWTALDQGPVRKTHGNGQNSLREQKAKKTEKVEKWGKNCLALGLEVSKDWCSPTRFVRTRKKAK